MVYLLPGIPDTKTEEKENKSAISSCPIALAHILNRLIVYSFGVDYGWLLNGKSTKLYHLFFGMFVFKWVRLLHRDRKENKVVVFISQKDSRSHPLMNGLRSIGKYVENILVQSPKYRRLHGPASSIDDRSIWLASLGWNWDPSCVEWRSQGSSHRFRPSMKILYSFEPQLGRLRQRSSPSKPIALLMDRKALRLVSLDLTQQRRRIKYEEINDQSKERNLVIHLPLELRLRKKISSDDSIGFEPATRKQAKRVNNQIARCIFCCVSNTVRIIGGWRKCFGCCWSIRQIRSD